MTALVYSEWLKIRTTRGWWAYLIVIVLLVGAAAATDTGTSDEFDRSTVSFQVGLLEAAGFAGLLALILGITVVTTEFRHGTVTPTFLAAPNRGLVLAAKTIAGSLVALLFSVLAMLVIAAVAVPWLAIVDAEIHLGNGEIGTRVGYTLLGAVVWALMGLAIGSVVHSQVAALVGTLIWAFLGETLLWGLLTLLDLDGAVSYLPFRALDAADGTAGGEDLLSYWPGVAVSLGWVALIGAAGAVRTGRRDIT